MPVKANREYRSIEIGNIVTRAKDDDERMIVEGYATTFNSIYTLYSYSNYEVQEQIAPDAFGQCDMSDVIMQYDHEGRVFARTSNGTLELKIDDHGLLIRADLSGTELGRQLYGEIGGRYITKMSFGFVVGEDKREETEDHDTGKITVLRTITRIDKLYDVSAVSLPANDATEISARSFGEGVIKKALEEVRAIKERQRNIHKIKILMEV